MPMFGYKNEVSNKFESETNCDVKRWVQNNLMFNQFKVPTNLVFKIMVGPNKNVDPNRFWDQKKLVHKNVCPNKFGS